MSWALRSAGGNQGGEWRWRHFVRGCARSGGFREACGIGRCSCCIRSRIWRAWLLKLKLEGQVESRGSRMEREGNRQSRDKVESAFRVRFSAADNSNETAHQVLFLGYKLKIYMHRPSTYPVAFQMAQYLPGYPIITPRALIWIPRPGLSSVIRFTACIC